MSIGERIRRWREWAGLSKNDLAADVGVSPEAVMNWERDANDPSFKSIVAIARAVGVTLAAFFGAIPRKAKAA